jgi:hypothetical protein
MTLMNERAASDGARHSTVYPFGRMSLCDAAVMTFPRPCLFD